MQRVGYNTDSIVLYFSVYFAYSSLYVNIIKIFISIVQCVIYVDSSTVLSIQYRLY